jgi:hypothetical protein
MLSTLQPVAYVHPLWEVVHGEPCIDAPGPNEFRTLLESWGIVTDIEAMEPMLPRSFPDAAAALNRAAGRLHVKKGSPELEKLRVAVDAALVNNGDGKLTFKWDFKSVPYVFSWRTDS